MPEPDKIARLRDGYAAFNAGDAVDWDDFLTEDFEVRERAEVPDPRTARGAAHAASLMLTAGEDFDDYVIEPRDFIEVGDCIVVCARQSGRGKASGALVEGDIFHVWRLRGDKVSGMHAFSTREEAVAAAREW